MIDSKRCSAIDRPAPAERAHGRSVPLHGRKTAPLTMSRSSKRLEAKHKEGDGDDDADLERTATVELRNPLTAAPIPPGCSGADARCCGRRGAGRSVHTWARVHYIYASVRSSFCFACCRVLTARIIGAIQ